MGKEIKVKTMEMPFGPSKEVLKAMQNPIQKEAQNSFVFRRSGPSTEVKVYYTDIEDLKKQLSEWERDAKDIAEHIEKIKGKFLKE